MSHKKETLPSLMNRETVIDIRDAAIAYSDTFTNESWKDAFRALANAADRIDAMIARTEVHIVTEDQVYGNDCRLGGGCE